MNALPLIGMNADFRPAEKGAPGYTYIADGYYDALARAGAAPVIVPPVPDVALDRILDSLDGFVLVGGADLDPRTDGFELHPSLRLLPERRETFDRLLMRRIAARHLPVLAIGAGMQLLNVAMGGTLHLHLPADKPKALQHADHQDPAHLHQLSIIKESLVGRVYTLPSRTTSRNWCHDPAVVSQHHMAIDDVAPGFTVTATCRDGVIEAIEWSHDDWVAIGVQFHPESPHATMLDFGIFEEWLALVREPKMAFAG